MHVNFHIAIGILFANIASIFFPLDFLTYSILILFSFIPDLDIIVLKFSDKTNHRLFISHTIYPSLILLLLGVVFSEVFLYLLGFQYLLHIIFDILDWGTNLFYTDKIVGGIILMGPMTMKKLEKETPGTPNFEWFFQKRYYFSQIIKIFEIVGFMFMLTSIIFFGSEYYYYIGLYFLALVYHIYRFYSIKHQIPKD